MGSAAHAQLLCHPPEQADPRRDLSTVLRSAPKACQPLDPLLNALLVVRRNRSTLAQSDLESLLSSGCHSGSVSSDALLEPAPHPLLFPH